ncbi:MAG TPA: trypsin-like peptidase domain-containing protein, partial [Thermoanaerobaculia bacterium]|nr:trypsin-like peptidase domain-containing protein [Thermoanaerobaculia bacterium]
MTVVDTTVPAFTNEQVADFAELLAREVGTAEIRSLAGSFLGDDSVRDLAETVGDASTFAHAVVSAMRDARRLTDVISHLRRESLPNSAVALALAYILDGRRLSDEAALQAYTHEREAFFGSDDFVRDLQNVSRTICAIGLGEPHNILRGSGFLIGPDLVMTSYHVLEPFLQRDDGMIRPRVKGELISCFFDYLARPEPHLPFVAGRSDTFLGVTAASQDWLVHAREPLPWEGQKECPPDAGTRYDFAVIRLSRRVGTLPLRLSGGRRRGWLHLPEAIEVAPDRRIILHQHPEKAPLQFDIGRCKGPDPTKTRVRYTTSSGKGSSGAAAVDINGQLFALHTASVVPDHDVPERLNQGVRIDLIAKDLNLQVPG